MICGAVYFMTSWTNAQLASLHVLNVVLKVKQVWYKINTTMQGQELKNKKKIKRKVYFY